MSDESPIKITDAELVLLSNTQALTATRNELMHRTFIEPEDLGAYAKSVLSINLVFEQRCHDVAYAELESHYRADAEVALQLSWMKGETTAFFKEAIAYLSSVGASKHPYLGCPVCGSPFIVNDVCRACRTELIQRECPQCGNDWIEHRDDESTYTKCPDCDK